MLRTRLRSLTSDLAARLRFRSPGKRAAPRGLTDVIVGFLVWLASVAVVGVVGSAAWWAVSVATGLAQPPPPLTDPSTQAVDSSPVRFSVKYGSVNDAAAIFSDGLPEMPAPVDYFEKLDWIAENGGTLANNTVAILGIAAPGALDEPVYINDIRVRPIHCGPALPGVYMPPLGAGDTFDRILDYQLDDVPGENRKLLSFTGEPWRFPLWVDATETEVVSIILSAYSGAYEFVVDLDYDYQGRSYTSTIEESENGMDLKITGKENGGDVLWRSSSDPGTYELVGRDQASDFTPGFDPYAFYPGFGWEELTEASPPTSC